MKYSIIVSTFNSEKHIVKCIDSLVNQTVKNMEIIIVDDGSIDGTKKILDKYEKKYKFLKVIYQPHNGPAMARRVGIKNASGAYCAVVDSDDWVEKNMLKRIECIINENKDIELIKFKFRYEPVGDIGPNFVTHGRILNSTEIRNLRRDLLISSKYNNLCNQVFKTELYPLYDGKHSRRMFYGEDAYENLDIIGKANKIILIEDALYHYRQNEDSSTHKLSYEVIKRNIKDNIALNKKRISYLNKLRIKDITSENMKEKTVLFSCNQIKRYISLNGCLDKDLIQMTIDDSGLLDFTENISEKKIKGLTNRLIYRCMKKRNYKPIGILSPYIILLGRIKDIYKGVYASKKSNL